MGDAQQGLADWGALL
jgi:hypothetical protein